LRSDTNDEEAANPDAEIIRALRPAIAEPADE
jgi:hypothetical protein